MRPEKNKMKVKPDKPKSQVWKYFDDCEDGKHVLCLLCKALNRSQKLTSSGGQTSSLRFHLEHTHQKNWQEILAEEEILKVEEAKKRESDGATSGAKRKTAQPKIDLAFQNMTKSKWSPTEPV